jgi:hypothetical protein
VRLRHLWPSLVAALIVLAALAVRMRGETIDRGVHPCDREDVPMPPGAWDTRSDPASPLVGSWAGLWGGARASRLVVTSVRDGEADLTYGIVAWATGLGPYREGSWHGRAGVGRDGRSVAWGALTFTLDPHSDVLHGTYVTDGRLGGTVVMTRCPAGRVAHAPAR